MSTVVPAEDGAEPVSVPITNIAELWTYFAGGEKSRDAFRVGTEHEKFGFLHAGNGPLPYFGKVSIESLFDSIVADETERKTGPWRRVEERGNTIALYKKGATISLEPGGQLELSGAPLTSVYETQAELESHIALLRRVCLPMGVGFVAMGFHPEARRDEMPDVPKSRYGIMRSYMPRKGSRGLDMMKRTATVQANFDYENEADMVASFRLGLAVAPIVTALFANSPWVEGKQTDALSERMVVWQDTDSDRSGFPEIVFKSDFGYEKWLEYVLQVPMYFIRRSAGYLNYAGADFRDFIAGKLDGHVATIADFEDHLTTIFTEVRLKRFLEVRSADSGNLAYICALPALYKALFYDVKTRERMWDMMEGPTAEELRAFQRDATRRGFDATYRGRTLHALSEELLESCKEGLTRLAAQSGTRDERPFLDVLEHAVASKMTAAQVLVQKLHNDWDGDFSALWKASDLLAPDDVKDDNR